MSLRPVSDLEKEKEIGVSPPGQVVQSYPAGLSREYLVLVQGFNLGPQTWGVYAQFLWVSSLALEEKKNVLKQELEGGVG